MNTKLIGIAVLAFGLTACGERSGTATSSNETAAAATVPIALGITGHAKDVDMTVTAVTTSNHVGPAGVGAAAEKGETFVVVAYTLRNTGDKPLPLMDRPAVSLLDAKGQSYAPDQLAAGMAAAMTGDVSGMTADLNPNVSAKTKTAWKIDKASFDKATWRIVVAADPSLTFALK